MSLTMTTLMLPLPICPSNSSDAHGRLVHPISSELVDSSELGSTNWFDEMRHVWDRWAYIFHWSGCKLSTKVHSTGVVWTVSLADGLRSCLVRWEESIESTSISLWHAFLKLNSARSDHRTQVRETRLHLWEEQPSHDCGGKQFPRRETQVHLILARNQECLNERVRYLLTSVARKTECSSPILCC